jgi:hypothetical protein
MTARVFISYRSSDGADKATALARDLDARFGNDQVFLDKEDLPAGSRWRDAIARALHDSPILIVLVTPHYLGAVDADGKRCIERRDDPARSELEAGFAAGAHVIPLLCDGVIALPAAADLPGPFDRLSDLQWGRLRAFDWREDLARLADDLRRLGVSPAASSPDVPPTQPMTQPITTPMPLDDGAPVRPGGAADAPADRRLAIAAGALALLGLGSWGFWRWRRRRRVDLSGRWSARIGARGAPSSRDGELVVLELHQAGRKLALASSAVNIERDPDWQNYRDFWRQRNGTELRRVFYRGEGKVLGDDDEDADADTASAPTRSTAPPPKLVIARRIVVAVRIFAAGSESEPIDGGTLNGTVDVDDQRIHGRLWLESEQAERAVDLKRGT